MRDGKIIVARLWPGFGGGVESYTPVILGIKPEKYETIFIHLTKNSDNPNIFEEKGKKVFYITEKPRLPFFRPLVFLKLANLLKKESVDILHCHKHKSTVYGTIAGRLAGVPIILAHVHGLGRTRNFSRRLLNRFILSGVDKILTVGQAVKDDVLRNNPSVKPAKVINVGNTIDLDYFSSAVYDKQTIPGKFGIPQNSFVFATAGRLAPTKGQQYLISAFARIRKQLPNARLLIAGTGELKEELEKQALSLGCDSSVHFLGNVDNMPEFYSAVDVFVLPSIAEGLPRTLIEAIASGVLCIASNVGGIPEILDNGRFGILVPPKDENALADAMLAAANMPRQEKLSVISTANNYIKENYSHNAAIKRIEKIYDSLAAEKNVQKSSKSNKFSIQEKE
jgi:glycosyltransferase involved in cell wall biosynthesis